MKTKKVLSILLVVFVLVLVSCTAVPTPTPSPPIPTPSPTLEILSPEEGATLPAGKVTITIEVSDFNIVNQLGQLNAIDEGHIHYYLDAEPPTTPGQPTITDPGTYVATTELSHAWDNVTPGNHTLGVQLVNNDHTPLEPPVVATVTINISASTTEETTINLIAQNSAFDKDTITVPPGAKVTIVFNNRDSGYHNFALYQDSTASITIFVGETILGPRTINYQFIAPIAPGTYFFRCDVHPTTMTGNFIVSAASVSDDRASHLSTIPAGSIQVERVFSNLSFQEMTNLVQPDDTSGLIIITEQRGVIYAFTASQPEQDSYIFLDITDRVNRGGNEEGLLGIAFDPDYRENGHFYVYYSAIDPRRSVVSRFSLDQGNPGVADSQSEVIIMEVAQPFGNHNGGQLAFGPDGYLYIGLGDGGSAGDPQLNGQNLGTILGSILRIDVSGLSVTGDYEIPINNPFIDAAGARPEIWAFGLRNPWRFSFDNGTGLLWAGDVGQNIWEEIDIITKGANYGWNIMEGFHCYDPVNGCDQSGLTLPLVEYDHSQGCSVTGGYVYRGNKIPSLQGYYIYGDYCSGNIWALGYDGNNVTQNILLTESGLSITSFGEDLAGNLYILSREGGIYTLAQME